MKHNKNLRICGAPFEADWQLACMYNQGIIDCVISVNNDMLTLGIGFVIDNLDGKGKCQLIKLDNVLKRRGSQK